MSGLDINLGSQQFAAEQQWRGFDYETQGLQQATQFNQQQAAFGLQQQAMQAELKMQAFQMERQMNQQKVAEMLAIDELEQSRARTALINEQAEVARLQRSRMEKELDPEKTAFDAHLEVEKKKFSEWDKDPTLGFSAGWVQDTSSRFGWRPGSEDEVVTAVKRHEKVRPQSRLYDPAKDPMYRYYEQTLQNMSRQTFVDSEQFNALQEEFRSYVMGMGGDPSKMPKIDLPKRPEYAERARQSAYSQAHPAARYILQQEKIAPIVDSALQQAVEQQIKAQGKFKIDREKIIDSAVRTFWETPGFVARLLDLSGLSEPEIQQLIQQWYGLK